jgi:hypothetical protein
MKFLGMPSSGSIAGTTFSHNRAGQYTRNRRAPVQPIGTGRRGIIRSFFGAASTAWANISAADQAAWTSFAASHPTTDALGQSITLTGQQMFVGVNVQQQNVGEGLPASVPSTTTTTPPVLTAFTAIAAGAITLTLDGSGSASDFILQAFSAPQSGGVSFCKTFWQMSVVAADLATAQVITTAYTTQFGSPQAGNRIFYRFTPVNEAAWTGTPLIGFITVT